MEIDRHVERLGARQDRLECGVVEEAPVGRAVHQHADEAQLLDRALEFVRCRLGGEQRQMREAAVAVGMAGAGLGQRVVVGARKVDARLARHKVGAWAGDRQHLHGDPAGVHVREASVAEVREFVALGGLRPDEVGPGKAATGDRVGGDAGDDARDGVVFFQGDDAHGAPPVWLGGELHVGGGRATHQPCAMSHQSAAQT